MVLFYIQGISSGKSTGIQTQEGKLSVKDWSSSHYVLDKHMEKNRCLVVKMLADVWWYNMM